MAKSQKNCSEDSMSNAFEEFLTQFKKTGSEKADGYRRDAFIGLTELEKKIVFDYLVSELPWQIEWLFFINPQQAAVVAKNREAKERGNRYAHVYLIQKQLVNQCGEMEYQQHMIDDYYNYIDEIKPLVVDAIAQTPISSSSVSFFKNLILVESNEDALASASVHFLNSMGFVRDTESEKKIYLRLLKELRCGNDLVKIGAIEYIMKKGQLKL
jgi:hypothetical protein